jgi:hypothetical protein
MNYLKEIQRRVKEIELSRWVDYYLNDALKQLILLSRLRKIEDLTTKIAEEMPITYDLETDALYRKGEIKGEIRGIEKGRLEAAKNLIENTDFPDDKIAFLTNVTAATVKKIRAELM